jgi:hypothetical protein
VGPFFNFVPHMMYVAIFQLVRMIPDSHFSDAQIKERHIRFYGKETLFSDGHIPYFRNKSASLSEFLKEIK